MGSQATTDLWQAIAEMADLLTHLNATPPHDRATAARAPLLRYCVAIRGSFMDDPKLMYTLLKDAQTTMRQLRKLRKAGAPGVQ
jgi:hypothetical protein